jgi:hypothetical protein
MYHRRSNSQSLCLFSFTATCSHEGTLITRSTEVEFSTFFVQHFMPLFFLYIQSYQNFNTLFIMFVHLFDELPIKIGLKQGVAYRHPFTTLL